jgi:rhodanese-related sulfurtransferase
VAPTEPSVALGAPRLKGSRAGRRPVRQTVGVDAEQNVGIDYVLANARAGVRRMTPEETEAARRTGALVVDTRTEIQRREQGELPGAIVIDRTVLEWRLDPASEARIPEASDYDLEVVVVCRQGYSSSLAAARPGSGPGYRWCPGRPTCAAERRAPGGA